MNQFQELGISEDLVKGISELGFEKPTDIQAKAIPMLLDGENDFVGLAQTGTGKTAAFGLPLLQNIDDSLLKTQAFVIAPTRELSVQIAKDLVNFSKHTDIKVVAVYGGASIDTQIKALRRGAHIVVGTPGRMLDLLNRGKIVTNGIKQIVLDEADEMLNMGFQQDIDTIVSSTPEIKNVWLFSATMPKEVQRIAATYMVDPLEITVGSKNSTNENIEHHYYITSPRNRYSALKRIVDFYPDIFGVVFCKTKREAQEVAEKLIKDDYNADALHGDLSQAQRDKVMTRYRDKSLQLLIATDVAARGIDVSDVTHVINYGLPQDVENYTHRSGRTARAGKKGISICIVDKKDGGRIRQIEKIVNTKFVHMEIPSGETVLEKQFFNFLSNLKNVEVDEAAIESYMPTIESELESLSREELIKKVASNEFNNLLQYYRVDKDLNESFSGRGDRGGRDRDGGRGGRDFSNANEKRVFVNLGRNNDIDVGGIIRVICDNTGISGGDIGRIDLFDGYSFMQIKNEAVDKVTASSGSFDYADRTVRFEIANPKSGGGGRGHRGGGYRGGRGGDRSRRGSGGDGSRRRRFKN